MKCLPRTVKVALNILYVKRKYVCEGMQYFAEVVHIGIVQSLAGQQSHVLLWIHSMITWPQRNNYFPLAQESSAVLADKYFEVISGLA